MKTAIIRMLRFGSHYSVSLECGHKYDASLGEAKQRQSYTSASRCCAANTIPRREKDGSPEGGRGMTAKQEQQELEERRIRARGLMTNEEELEMERRATGRRASSYYAPPPPRQPLTLGSALYTGLYLLVMAFFPVTFPLMLAFHMVGFLR
jgi:hypothetical protein